MILPVLKEIKKLKEALEISKVSVLQLEKEVIKKSFKKSEKILLKREGKVYNYITEKEKNLVLGKETIKDIYKKVQELTLYKEIIKKEETNKKELKIEKKLISKEKINGIEKASIGLLISIIGKRIIKKRKNKEEKIQKQKIVNRLQTLNVRIGKLVGEKAPTYIASNISRKTLISIENNKIQKKKLIESKKRQKEWIKS